MSTPVNSSSIRSILYPNVEFSPSHIITYKSVKLDFSPSLGFQAFILCNNTNSTLSIQPTRSYEPAKVEMRSIELSHFKEKIETLSQAKTEEYFLSNFDIQVEKKQIGFRVILSSKSSLNSPSAMIRSTKELAEQLRLLPTQDSHYSPLKAMALAVIEIFAKTDIKNESLIEEVTPIALTPDIDISKELVRILVKEIKQAELLNIYLLKALRITLVNAKTEAFDQDDLIKVLNITIAQITEIHHQDQTNSKLYEALCTLADILDVMGDANVINVSRLNIHDPLYDILNELSNEEDILIASQGAYARQALVRVPNDESKFRSAVRHGQALVQGLASLYSAVSDQNLSALLDTYESFKEAVNFQERKKNWYGDIRILKLLHGKNLFEKFAEVTRDKIKDSTPEYIVGNILGILVDSVHHHPDLKARKWALEQMSDLFLDNKRWGDDVEVKKQILLNILSCARLPHQETADYAKNILGTFGAQKLTKIQKSVLVILPDLKKIKPQRPPLVQKPSTALIEAAQRSHYLSLDQKIDQMKEKVLNNKSLIDELATYIPVQGSYSIFDPKEKTFNLDQVVKTFLNGNHPIFLLVGDSGGGKSTYLRFLERELWKEWNSKKSIPLYISLPTLKMPFHDAINEALQKAGFTEDECKKLKEQYTFVFLLDGYDELKDRQNFYISNQLDQWQAKTIITCRTQYLMGEQSTYQNYFLPHTKNLISTTKLQEASISPFTNQQIEAYCRQFIQQHLIPRTWEQYKADFASMPDVQELIETPFLLRIICEVLPQMIEKHQLLKSPEQLKLLRIDLFDGFIKNWFNREEQRLIRTGKWKESTDVKKLFSSFANRLASEMLSAGIVSVDYEENTDLFSSDTSPWKPFFGPDSRMALIRSGVPLRQLGPYTHAFLHNSLLEYFGARSMLKESNKPVISPHLESKTNIVFQQTTLINPTALESTKLPVDHTTFSFDHLNKKLLTQEIEVIRLLAEWVVKNPHLQNVLFEFIERSKTTHPNAEVAAANAITILNIAGVDLSQRKFKGVRIPGADLSRATLFKTDLSDANLSCVRLTGAYLNSANFENSNVKDLEFSQGPFLEFEYPVKGMALSPSNQRILTYGLNNDAIISDVNNGKRLLTLKGHTGKINSAVFTRDGKWVVSGSEDGTVRIWDSETGEEHSCLQHTSFTKYDDEVLDFSVSPDVILSSRRDSEIGQEHSYLQRTSFLDVERDNNILSVSVSPDSNFILASNGKGFHLWDKQSSTELLYVERIGLDSITFSSDGKKALFSYWGNLVLWDLQFNKQIICLKDNYTCECFAVSFDGKMAVSGGIKGTIITWDLQTGEKLSSLTGHSSSITKSVAFSPNNKYILSGSNDSTVKLWDVKLEKELMNLQGHRLEVNNVAFSHDGNWAYSSSADCTIRQWNLSRIHTIKLSDLEQIPDLTNIAISSNSEWLLVNHAHLAIHSYAEVSLIDLNSGRFIHRLQIPTFSEFRTLQFSPDHQTIFLGTDYQFFVVDALSGKDKSRFMCDMKTEGIISSDLSPNSKWIALGCKNGDIELRNKNGMLIMLLRGHTERVNSISFSSDSNWIISGSFDTTIRIWDSQTGKEVHCLKGHNVPISSVAISRNGLWIASGAYDCTIRLWKFKTPKKEYCILQKDTLIDIVSFSPDDKWIISEDEDQTFRVWDIETGRELYCLKEFRGFLKVKFLFDRKHLVLNTNQGSIQKWQLFDANNNIDIKLIWKTGNILSAQNLNIKRVKGLSELNRKLLVQHGAVEDEKKDLP